MLVKTLYEICWICPPWKINGPLISWMSVHLSWLHRRQVISTDRKVLEETCEYLNKYLTAKDDNEYYEIRIREVL